MNYLTKIGALALSMIGTATLASAADLPVRGPAVAPAPVFVAFNWTGFYVGLNAGGAWGAGCNNIDPRVGGAAIAGWNNACRGGDEVAFMGGAQIGYNIQSGSLVYGIEADIQGLSNNGKSNSYAFAGAGGLPAGVYTLGGHRDPNVFGTVRARLGFAADRALFYITGGLAYGSGSRGVSGSYAPAVGAATTASWDFGGKGDGVGWALGAGVEYAFANNWTAKIEYLYADLGSTGGNGFACTGAGCVGFPGTLRWNGTSRNSQVNIVRVGVNYLWSSMPSPVIAKY